MTDVDEMEPVFKALADPHRRHLLDRLRERDGQTLSELQTGMPMTRFGVMKHLRLLEAAGLVASRKVGRERFHYLNPVPIQGVYDRWVSRYARPWSGALTGLKGVLESDAAKEDEPVSQTLLETVPPPAVPPPAHVYQIYIRTTPEQLWQALTDGDWTRRYYYDSRVESDWRAGSPYVFRTDDGRVTLAGEVIAAEPPRRLVTTFRPGFLPPDHPIAGSRVTFEIEPEGDRCRLTVVHDGLDPARDGGIVDGWARIFSGLKTLIETGEPLAAG